MKRFRYLTKYIPLVESGDFGYWTETTQNPNGTYILGHVIYPDWVSNYWHDFYSNKDLLEKYDVYNYQVNISKSWYLTELRKENCYKQKEPQSLAMELDILFQNENYYNRLSSKDVFNLLDFFIRGERFCEGVLLEALEDGSILKLLKRLKAIDDEPRLLMTNPRINGRFKNQSKMHG